MAEISICLQGEPTLRHADGPDLAPRSRKTLCLVAFLATQPEGRATRDRLCGLFWSDRGQDQARGSLRQSVMELRRAWQLPAPDLLIATNDTLQLNPDLFVADVVELDRLVADARPNLRKIGALWRGEFMAGVAAPDPAFGDWLLAERAQRNRQAERAVVTALGAAEQSGFEPEILVAAETVLLIEPRSEKAVRSLMEQALRQRDPGDALRRYEQFRAVLAQDLDTGPSAALEEVAQRARGAARTPARPAALFALAPRQLPSLLVRLRPPCGPMPAAACLQSLLQDELLLALHRARQFGVILQFDDTQIAADVDHTLDVSVTCDDRSARIAARLTGGVRGDLMFFDRVRVPLVGDEQRIMVEAGRIAFAVQHASKQQMVCSPRAGPDAYALFIAADRMTDSFLPEQLAAALPLLQQSAAADPLFARPVAGQASVLMSLPMVQPSEVCFASGTEQALLLARQAVGIDPWDARARIVLAWAYMTKRLSPLALAEFRRSLEIAPTNPDVLIAVAEGLAYFGQAEESLRAGELAFRIHCAPPDYYHFYLSIAKAMAGDYGGALQHQYALGYVSSQHLVWRCLILLRLGLLDEARASGQQLLAQFCLPRSPLGRDMVLRWLDQVILVPCERDRVCIVSDIAALLFSRDAVRPVR